MKISPLSLENGKVKENDEDYKVTRVNFAELVKEHSLKDPSFTFQDVKDEFTGLLTAVCINLRIS